MPGSAILLKALLIDRHWQKYETFCEEYDKAARIVDARLAGTWPSRSQYYRWLKGKLQNGVPQPDACRVLEQMFPEWTARQLLEAHPSTSTVASREPDGDRISGSEKKDLQPHVGSLLTSSDEFTTEDTNVNRSEFVRSLLFAGIGAVVPNVLERSVRSHHVEQYKQDLMHLYRLDDQHGGVAVYDITLRTVRLLRNLQEHGSYDTETGRHLHAVTGQVTEHAGWLAFDAAKHAEARHWWLEALHAARMVDDRETMVVALASMSLQAARTNRPREAIDLAQAAQRAAGSNAAPRLRALLYAREALGYAGDGNALMANRTLAKAAATLEEGRRGDDPGWIDFFDCADLSSHRTIAAFDLHDLRHAEESARIAFESADENLYPRNFALYGARLARVLTRLNETEEAMSLTTRAIAHTHALGSARAIDETANAVRAIAEVDDSRQASEFVEWSSGTLRESRRRILS